MKEKMEKMEKIKNITITLTKCQWKLNEMTHSPKTRRINQSINPSISDGSSNNESIWYIINQPINGILELHEVEVDEFPRKFSRAIRLPWWSFRGGVDYDPATHHIDERDGPIPGPALGVALH